MTEQVPAPAAAVAVPPRAAGWRTDLAIAALVLVVAGTWASQFWKAWTAHGGQPEFYQIYFEPAVMVACGKGFVISEQQPKVLEDFLWRRRDRLSCAELPADLKLGRDGLYQEAWTYLQYTVGWAWRVIGISWSGMAPLFGVFFGTVVALAYGILRLGMGRLLAMIGAFGIAVSPLHLLNLPHLRDYSKAPFTLALVLILGWIVTGPTRWPRLLALAAAYGTVLGLGYGFRTDLLINLPVLVLTVFAFAPGGLWRNLLMKAAATAVFLAAFVAMSWPITTAVVAKGGCQWHVALLGLQSPFERQLNLRPAPYDFGYAYADGYVIRGVQGYARRTQPAGPVPQYCSHEYDVQSGRLLTEIVTTFPADFVARAYASVLQIVGLPSLKLGPPMADWNNPVFTVRGMLVPTRYARGALFAAAALIIGSVLSVRVGLFLLFFLAYFGGYPAVQFQERHYFHLEFIAWWACGFALQWAAVTLMAYRHGRLDLEPMVRRLALRGGAVIVLAAVVFVGLLAGARWYQEGQARRLFAAYLDAPKSAVADPFAPLPAVAPGEWPQFLEVRLDEAKCDARPAVTFRYDPSLPDGDYTRTITLERRAHTAGTTRILLPVFEQYAGLQLSDERPGCFEGVSRFTDLGQLSLLLGVTLPPDWQSLPLYQRIAQFESDSEARAAADRPAVGESTAARGRLATYSVDGAGPR